MFAVCFCANAQLKGKFYLGGNLGLDFNSVAIVVDDGYDSITEDVGQIDAGVNFTAGYFLSDRWRVSLYYDANASLSLTNGSATTDFSYDSIGLGLSFYKEIADGLYYAPEVKVCGAWGDLELESNGIGFPLEGYSFNVSLLQLEYMPTEHFATSVNVGYLDFLVLGGVTTIQGYPLGVGLGQGVLTAGLRPTITFKYIF